MDLTDREKLFVEHYLTDPNALKAAESAGFNSPGYGRRVRWRPHVAAAIRRAQDARAETMAVKAEDVVRALARLAFADADELVEHRRVNCRHCHGREFRRQLTKPEMLERMDKGLEPDPLNIGVFDPWGDPNPECPTCSGYGESQVLVKDSRAWSGEARALFAGLRQRGKGVDVVTHDKVAALVLLGKHFGLFDGPPPAQPPPRPPSKEISGRRLNQLVEELEILELMDRHPELLEHEG